MLRLISVVILVFFAANGIADDMVRDIEFSIKKKIHSGEVLAASALTNQLRSENISDDEIREIQRVIGRMYPAAIFQIGGVTNGCTCGEHPDCTNQVSIVSDLFDSSVGLTLSKIKRKWMIGTLQEWWLNYNALDKSVTERFDGKLNTEIVGEIYRFRIQHLYNTMPICRVPETETVATQN